MAAGIIQGTVTTTTGETIEMSWLVDDTVTPTKWYNVSHLVNAAGAGAAFGSGVAGTTVLRVLSATDDPIVTQLTAGALTIAKAEDVASGGGDVGVPAMAVQQSAPANTGANADYGFLQMSLGALWVAPPATDKMTAVVNSFTAAGNGTAYIAGEWISDNATAGSVTKLQWTPTRGAGTIRKVRIRKSDQTVATPTIRLYLWDATFTVAVGDNATGAQPLQDSIYFVDVAVTNAGTDDAVGWTNIDIPYEAAAIFGLIQSQSTFTGGTSEVWTIDLWEIPG